MYLETISWTDIFIFYAANIKELAPPCVELEQRIKDIYRLPKSERTFSLSFASSSQKSSSDMSTPAKIPEVFDLDKLDNYSGPVQVKKEQSPKPATSSKPTSSKSTTIPKPSPATKTRAYSARKRKETDSPTTPETFPYENHRFVEASGFMNSFLNQKAEVTITDQGMITAAKSKHYEDKFKAMTEEHQAPMKNAAHEAQAKLDGVQVQDEQDMASYREGLKSSVVFSLLQARLKLAYEAKIAGFECPTWTIKASETKLKDLCGAPVEYPVKPIAGESSKAVEMAVDAGGEGDAVVEGAAA
ncbi:hypothetical protein Hanom_Chr17g01581661 [Helianthus anomalus]